MAVPLLSARELVRGLGDWHAGGAAYAQLARRLGRMLADGRIASSVRLPAERELARELGVSRQVVSRAYAVLRSQSLLITRWGAGSVTNLPAVDGASFEAWAAGGLPATDAAPVVELARASLPADARVIAAIKRTAAQIDALVGDDGYYPFGVEALRAAIADRFTRRGLPTAPEEILITAGAQQAIDLVIRALVPRRDAIVVESPAYAGALDSLRLARARVVALDVADAAWDLDALDARLAQTGARLALLTPDFQNPTGHLMPDAQRERLAAIARRRSATLIVDETLCELDLDGGEAPRPLARHANGDVAVITIGSLSKCAWAGLRVGWVRARPQLLTRLAHLRSAADLSGAPVEQLAAVGLIAELDAILAERRPLLREQMSVVLDAARGLGWSAAAPAGGLSVWARLPRGSATALAEAAASRGLRLAPGQRLSPDGALDSYVRLPFTLPAGELRSAMERLAGAWDDVGATRRPRDQRRGHDGRQHPGRRTAPVHDE